MSEVIQLSSIKHYLKKKKEIRDLDITASYVSLEQCLFTLNLNSLPETEEIKQQISKTLKKLKQNAKEKSL